MGYWPYHLTIIAAVLAAAALACGLTAGRVLRTRGYSRLQTASASLATGIAAVLFGLALLPYVLRALATQG